jgi:hypothetical protein
MRLIHPRQGDGSWTATLAGAEYGISLAQGAISTCSANRPKNVNNTR